MGLGLSISRQAIEADGGKISLRDIPGKGCVFVVEMPLAVGDPAAAALCGIKEVGGITIAQSPDTAGAPDMPVSAIASGCIDFVLAPENIAEEITRIARAVSRAE